MYQGTKFDVCQTKASDIEQSVYSYDPFDPQNQRSQLLHKMYMYQCTMFDVCQAKCPQYI
jgi:hypothetical protein